MKFIKFIKNWIFTKILGRTYICGVDLANTKDFGCKVEGYKDKKGNVHIEKITYL